MVQHSRTWWGKRFLDALRLFCDGARLSRGNAYSGPDRLLHFEIDGATIRATVRGNVNPYYGVYKEPRYQTTIALTNIPAPAWERIIRHLSTQASSVAQLLMNQMPDDIEASFKRSDERLLPVGSWDFQTSCSCPDWANPCKHVAGVCYRLAAELDANPFLLFELRGLSREALQAELLKSPLGRALASQLEATPLDPVAIDTYYTRPGTVPLPELIDLKRFWHGEKHLPPPQSPRPTAVAALLVKTQGDYPAFWHRDNSFIAVMEQLYERVRTKNRDRL
ncbi:SWIM zinc finger family protein [Gloeobacter kilaueensis]|uniref:SWIM-type domain-containing protein n=1 Tax=Gloeobacter kilaueensis (strain ATCC BAA-2537 / CCAP 1431/1 / ULC 316 / JS1) TaxID=1183438 RepID=U5QM32_GLOK1|nr:SWIM zinc finger family protein [Gloeobacter kilaueensis]AGY60042.1 hypothetical protein GKIL_3796 [Gloeobacter kilaueensis JS1]